MPISLEDPGYMEQMLASLFSAPGALPPLNTDPPLVNPAIPPQIGGMGNGQLPPMPPATQNPAANPFVAGGNPPPPPQPGGPFIPNAFPPAPPPNAQPWQPPAWWAPNVPPQFQGQGQLMPGAGNPGPMMQGMPGMNAMFPFMGQGGGSNIFGGQSGATTSPQGQGNIFGGQSAPTVSQSPFASLPQGVRPLGTRPIQNFRPGNVRPTGATMLGNKGR